MIGATNSDDASEQYALRVANQESDIAALLLQYAVVSVTDAAGLIVEANEQCCTISGYTREELLGSNHRVLNSGTREKSFWQQFWRTIAQGKSWRGEVCNRAKNRSLYYLDSMVTGVCDQRGKIVKYISVCFDITAHKDAERRLRERQIHLERAEAISGVGSYSINLDTLQQVWSPRIHKIFEYAGTVAPSLAQFVQWAPPESQAQLQQATDAVASGGTGFDLELPLSTARGSAIWVRITGMMDSEQGALGCIVGAMQDITARWQSQQDSLIGARRLALATQVAQLGIWEWDLLRDENHWNERMCQLWGIDPTARTVTTEMWTAALHPQDRDQVLQWFLEIQSVPGMQILDYRVMLPGGVTRHLHTVCQVEHDADGKPLRMMGVDTDATQQRRDEVLLADAASRDKLTGLMNRMLFMARLGRAIARVRDGEQRYYALLFLDFDRFKIVNDTLGHVAGDELLRQIAGRLRGILRASDMDNDNVAGNCVSRFGGDEFLVLINDLAAIGDVDHIAGRLSDALAPAYDIFGSAVHSSASIGIFSSEHGQVSADEAVGNADAAMYEAKRAGRGRSVTFGEAMRTRLTRRAQLETGLRSAIGTAQISVVYQPIIELSSGRMVSAEALVRWNHPTLGQIPPAEFIPVAEESGLIEALDEGVLNEACRMMVTWRREDPERAPATISVNLSRAELALGEKLLNRIRLTLEASGLPAHCLQLELTEREVMRDPEVSLQLMHELKNLGVKLAMDDFGTGSSSLGCLREYPFDTIKIDRSFVLGLIDNADVLAVIHATIVLIENLHMASLAEGIEEQAQVAVLQSLGCRYAQGYLFSRPVPAEQLLGAVKPLTF